MDFRLEDIVVIAQAHGESGCMEGKCIMSCCMHGALNQTFQKQERKSRHEQCRTQIALLTQ